MYRDPFRDRLGAPFRVPVKLRGALIFSIPNQRPKQNTVQKFLYIAHLVRPHLAAGPRRGHWPGI
jgi:hypothetical protein